MWQLLFSSDYSARNTEKILKEVDEELWHDG